MIIEQRHVTSINLQDGKTREFGITRDAHACTISGITGDEVIRLVLSPQDYRRLSQALGQAAVKGSWGEGTGNGCCNEAGTAAFRGIRVERRHVTTIAFDPSCPQDFVITHDDRGYKVSSLGRDEVVTLLLSHGDFGRLGRQLHRWHGAEGRAEVSEAAAVSQTPRPTFRPTAVRRHEPHMNGAGHGEETLAANRSEASPYVWSGLDWLGYN